MRRFPLFALLFFPATSWAAAPVAVLAGSVSDDGLPNPPGAVTVSWSMVSGPQAVTFSNPASLTPAVTFPVAGVYVLRLQASDGALTATDDVTITVNPRVNQRPVVNAGQDQAVILPGLASLSGTVSDDGLPNPPGLVGVSWTMISGPAQVGFSSAASLSTQVSFTQPGVYTFRLQASDSVLVSTDDVTVIVNPAVNWNVDAVSLTATADTIGAHWRPHATETEGSVTFRVQAAATRDFAAPIYDRSLVATRVVIDGLEPNTLYHVRVQVAGSTAWSGISSIMTQASPKALSIQSHAAYPNPVVGRHPVALRLEVAGAAQSASSAIYDLSGRKLAEVPLTQSQTGIWTASWPTDDVASGVLQVVTTVTGDGGKQIVRSKIAVVK